MGDEADALQDQSDEGEPGHIRCRRCHKNGLKWKDDGTMSDNWVLIEPDGSPHNCEPRPVFKKPKAPLRGLTTETYCEGCQEPFMVRVADLKRGWGRFCSKRCKAQNQPRR